MQKFEIIATQTPGIVKFDNYNELKENLKNYIKDNFENIDYSKQGIDVAKADQDELKGRLDIISKAKKELKSAYSAPYIEVEAMLNNLEEMLKVPYKRAKEYVDSEEKNMKTTAILEYAREKASVLGLGDVGEKIVKSPAFFNKDWLLKKYTIKKYQNEIDGILKQSIIDLTSIQKSGGEKEAILKARYFETLSMDGVKSFLSSLTEENVIENENSVDSDNNVRGYKIVKITATEDQMAFVMNQMDLLGIEVEEIEDGMPKPMQELVIPDFDSFVAFDIETTGTNGVAAGDGEPKITEIGAVKVLNGVVVEKFDEFANPGRKIVPMISRMTHITDEMVADKPPVDEVIKRFKAFVGDNVMVGHNIKSSDLRYITKAANKAGVCFDNAFLDTYILAKKFKNEKGWDKVNLGYLANYYGIDHKEEHRAWSDAEVNEQVYFELKKLYEA